MKCKVFLTAVLLMGASSLFAITPPPLPNTLPPQPQLPIPPQSTRPTGPPVTSYTRAMIHGLALSDAIEAALLHNLHFTDAAPTGTSSARTTATTRDDAAENPLSAISFTTVIATSQAVADANEDIEPAVITNRFNGVDRTTTAYIKYPVPNTFVPRIYWRSTTDFITFNGQDPFPIPSTHNESADPMLAENPYLPAPDNAFGKRTYCSGVSLDVSGVLGASALNVWWTDDPATNTWTRNEVATTNNPYLYDKPSVWVSWRPGMLGYTYVAAVLAGLNGNNTIEVYRKTTTDTFVRISNRFSAMHITSPIITTDDATGDLYLLWVDWDNNAINIARWPNDGVSTDFATPASFAAGSLLGSGGVNCDVNGANCVRASSVIMARPNAADNSIGVVWHRREAIGTNTDVYFNSFALQGQTWRGALPVNYYTKGDQWNAALDPDSSGNYLVTFYSRYKDISDTMYKVYARKIAANGTGIDPQETLVYSTGLFSDVREYTVDSSVVPARRYLGEYQDVWYWYGTWFGATIYVPDPAFGGSGQGDPYLTRVQP